MPSARRLAGVTVVCHYELFPSGADDVQWLAVLGAYPDWLVFTKEGQIRRRPLETRALRHAGLRVVALTSGNLSGKEQARAFVKALPKIRRLARRKGPFIARVLSRGAVSILAE